MILNLENNSFKNYFFLIPKRFLLGLGIVTINFSFKKVTYLTTFFGLSNNGLGGGEELSFPNITLKRLMILTWNFMNFTNI